MASGADKSQTLKRDTDLRSLLPAGHFLVDKFGLIHEVDQTGAVQLGGEISFLLKSSFLNRVVWDDRDIFTSHLRQVFDKKEQLPCETRLVRNNGSVFYAYIKSFVVKDRNDTEELCRITVRDISFIRLLENLLCKEINFTESIMRSSVDGIVAFDTIYQIVEWNPAIERMTGISRRDCIGKNVLTVFPFLKKIGEDRYLDAALKGRKVTSRNRQYLAVKAGRMGFFDAHYAPVKDGNGNVSGGIAIIKDITDVKMQEKELIRAKKLETIGSLASGFIHDYNNLLTGILGNISLAKLYMDPGEKSYELVDKASKIILRARDLARQLTMLASGEVLERKPAFIGPMLRNLLDLTLSDSHIFWHCDLDNELWPVEIDEGQFWQAIYTILAYIKESSPEGGHVYISATNAVIARDSSLPLLEGKYVLISTTKDIDGTPTEKTAANRDPFGISAEGAEEPTERAALSIAYSIISNHQGLLTVEAATDFATTFNIFLPATLKIVNSNANKIELSIARKGKILIMDDDEDVRDIAGKILNHIGFDTVFAHDGEEVVRAYMDAINSGKPFDIVILDFTIQGGMGGKEAITRLLDIDPDVRAIVSSGYSNDPVMKEFAKYGFKGAIAKPFKIGELSETVSALIKN
ncbi:MAG: PAS domain S-box protein [Dissulfurispiraceae bacterium]